MVDWKESDTARHKCYTGAGNEQIEENLHRLCADGKQVVLRCPIIPGYNDREDHFRKIAGLTQELPLVGAELMPYHSMGVSKIAKFGLEDRIQYITAREPDKETVRRWWETCRRYGGRMIHEDK